MNETESHDFFGSVTLACVELGEGHFDYCSNLMMVSLLPGVSMVHPVSLSRRVKGSDGWSRWARTGGGGSVPLAETFLYTESGAKYRLEGLELLQYIRKGKLNESVEMLVLLPKKWGLV